MTITPELLVSLKRLIVEAGDAIMKIYQDTDAWNTQQKENDTPVTAADLAAQEILISGLSSLTPDLPILSEEGQISDWAVRQHWLSYWLLDPLDGTREFLQRNGEFTVNIALIHQSRAILGLVYSPASKTLYWGGEQLGAWKSENDSSAQRISVRPRSKECILLTSRRHSHFEQEALNQLIDQGIFEKIESQSLGSSLKFCHIAEGKADLYLRISPTSEWDTAAAQAILEAAGGTILQLPEACSLHYNTKASTTNPSLIALACPKPIWISNFNVSTQS